MNASNLNKLIVDAIWILNLLVKLLSMLLQLHITTQYNNTKMFTHMEVINKTLDVDHLNTQQDWTKDTLKITHGTQDLAIQLETDVLNKEEETVLMEQEINSISVENKLPSNVMHLHHVMLLHHVALLLHGKLLHNTMLQHNTPILNQNGKRNVDTVPHALMISDKSSLIHKNNL